jgi:hypothetical protein
MQRGGTRLFAAQPASDGRVERMRVQGENGTCFPCRRFGAQKKGRQVRRPHRDSNAQAAFFAVFLLTGSGVFFALSFAANSCLTLAAMASVSTL